SEAPADYRVPTLAKGVRAALESRCPSWTVAGNSLGGWVALELALDWPAGVERLVLLDSAGIDEPTGAAEENGRALAEPTVEKLKEFRRRARHQDRVIPERVWPSAVAAIAARPTKKIVDALDRGQLLDGRLKDVKAPAAILWGASDRIIPVDVGERLHRGLKGSTLTVIPECGHLPQQECPEPVVAALTAR
ncbi:MAG: alpha/beta hydrolase, partial [Elusimicrobia bacterium]|nr:alpha/beta hydrolase [Elusimicrobiota bacterium]